MLQATGSEVIARGIFPTRRVLVVFERKFYVALEAFLGLFIEPS
jgi:hypothetical protein